MAEKNDNINKLGKDLDKVIKDMKKAGEQFTKASAEKRPELLTKLKDLTREKNAVKGQLATAISDAEKDPMLNISEGMPKLTELVPFNRRSRRHIQRLLEASVPVGAVEAQLDKLGAELKKDGEDITDDEVAAAALDQLVNAKGDLNKVDPDKMDIEEVKRNIRESRGMTMTLNESGGAALHAIEAIMVFLGNAGLIEWLAKALSKFLGKSVNPGKIKAGLKWFADGVKALASLPMKAVGKFIGFLFKIITFGQASDSSVKIAEISGKGLLVVAGIALGVVAFPLAGASVLGICLSIGGLIGKALELKHLWHEMKVAFAELKDKKEFQKQLGGERSIKDLEDQGFFDDVMGDIRRDKALKDKSDIEAGMAAGR